MFVFAPFFAGSLVLTVADAVLVLDVKKSCHGLSSDARCNTPRFGIGRIETSGSVAMRGYSHLSDDEREQIGLLKVLGHSIGAIARALRRPKSTISRELSRNRLASGRYSPLHAAGAYQLRRRREALIEKDRALRTFVLDRLAEWWTPEQIAGWLKAGNERCLRSAPILACHLGPSRQNPVDRRDHDAPFQLAASLFK